jgi:putative DNA primase/helicase
VVYDPTARLPLWDDFLAWFQPDEDMRAFLQKAAGYCLTGLGSEEELFFPFGNTRTGKSTFLRALRTTWGPEYATTADPETWMKRQAANGGPRNGIAGLYGKRLVVSSEVAEGAALAEWLVKWLFGGEYVKARFFYKEAFEFLPTFKLWLSANYCPKVAPDDEAVWHRLRQIPCAQQVAEGEENPSIKERLNTPEVAGPAILAWAVQG